VSSSIDAGITPPSVETRRALREGLRAAREAASAQHWDDATARFTALLHDHPELVRLRCEAGFAAFRAGHLDDAERLVSDAIAGWPSPPRARDRVSLAMCLYNRGLVAEARGDHGAAAEAWRRSIALRPNATVAQRLAALGDVNDAGPAIADDDGPCSDDPDGYPPCTIEAAIANGFPMDVAPSETVRVPSPTTPGRIVARVHYEQELDDDDPDSAPRSVDLFAVQDTRRAWLLTASVDWEPYLSALAEHYDVSDPQFFPGTAETGELVAIEVSSWRIDDECDAMTDVDRELYVCAEHHDWACAQIGLTEERCFGWAVRGCGDQAEGSCSELDEDDDDAPRVTQSGSSVEWRIDGGDLVLTREDTSPEDPPEVGPSAIASLF
jgi:tetratricopeptide (TPR) repeat protein